MSDIETRINEKMKPHPETGEFGCWLGRDELFEMFRQMDAADGKREDRLDELEDENRALDNEIDDIKEAVGAALDEIAGGDVDAASKSLREALR